MAKCYVYEINTTDGKRYGLAHTCNDQVFWNGAKWKTAKGAKKYAEKHGHELVEK